MTIESPNNQSNNSLSRRSFFKQAGAVARTATMPLNLNILNLIVSTSSLTATQKTFIVDAFGSLMSSFKSIHLAYDDFSDRWVAAFFESVVNGQDGTRAGLQTINRQRNGKLVESMNNYARLHNEFLQSPLFSAVASQMIGLEKNRQACLDTLDLKYQALREKKSGNPEYAGTAILFGDEFYEDETLEMFDIIQDYYNNAELYFGSLGFSSSEIEEFLGRFSNYSSYFIKAASEFFEPHFIKSPAEIDHLWNDFVKAQTGLMEWYQEILQRHGIEEGLDILQHHIRGNQYLDAEPILEEVRCAPWPGIEIPGVITIDMVEHYAPNLTHDL